MKSKCQILYWKVLLQMFSVKSHKLMLNDTTQIFIICTFNRHIGLFIKTPMFAIEYFRLRSLENNTSPNMYLVFGKFHIDFRSKIKFQ